jgi:hypothetical protein
MDSQKIAHPRKVAPIAGHQHASTNGRFFIWLRKMLRRTFQAVFDLVVGRRGIGESAVVSPSFHIYGAVRVSFEHDIVIMK